MFKFLFISATTILCAVVLASGTSAAPLKNYDSGHFAIEVGGTLPTNLHFSDYGHPKKATSMYGGGTVGLGGKTAVNYRFNQFRTSGSEKITAQQVNLMYKVLPPVVREISEQYDLQVLRFFMLNAHYRSPLNFSADLMESSKNALERITEAAGRLKDRKEKASAVELTEAEKKLLAEAEGYVKKFEEAMEDDFNTADALAAVFELVKFANTNVTEESSAAFAEGILEILVKLCDVLGLAAVKKEEILDKEIEDLIAERQEARKAKNFARADEIRDELLAKGIILKDTREGVKWKRA